MARSLNEWLWQHEFWLPPGITWEDVQESEDIHYPQPRDLLLSISFALILVVIRCAFERAIALPLSSELGVRDKQRPKAQPNPMLEMFYSTCCKNPEEGELIILAKQCDLPVRKVERWFRCRRNTDRPSLSKKFCEACWRFTFYIISFFTGLAVLHDKPWFWDHRECWTGYPQQFPLSCRVLYNTYYYSMEIFQPFFGYYFMNALLITLQLLHVFWSCLIIHIVYKFILQGTMEKDMRSDTEESDKDEEREKIRVKEKNRITYFSNVTSNNYVQRNGSEPLSNRTHLTNGHVKER
ncbi:ceramide synthase 4-like [Phalacrocorax aristotelis]|uniref:ceramide synthase 4-like n=1 Tax=Phalacrocorax aristotelis TaxID=126867 RepID=UPI003F4C0664